MAHHEGPLRLDRSLTHVAEDAYVAHNATIVGDVHVGSGASIWFGAVLRADTEVIRIGARSNVQDGTIVHADPGFPCIVADDVTIGHRCVVHGCRIGARTLIGMSTTLMNGAQIGEESLVGAGALVTSGKVFPPRSLILGAPARRVRGLTDDELASVRESAEHYHDAGQQYRASSY